MLTCGILIATGVGAHYTGLVEVKSVGTEAGALALIQDQAWRAMFLTAIYPGLLFLVGSFLVTESPRWLFRRGRREEALAALRRSRVEAEAQIELAEMAATIAPAAAGTPIGGGTLWQRKYLVPFLLACAVLGLTQATGINSILQFLVVILQKAGLPAAVATQRATLVTAVNVVFTVFGLLLVDKAGRKALLMVGTGGIALALIAAAGTFYAVESQRVAAGPDTGNLVMASLMIFMASFAIGPGVCVWLALSELMPMRIRSLGMGFGLLINQGISFSIAALFLPIVRNHGYAPMFVFWAGCTVVYFLIAALLLPETKGKTLEEIEAGFAGKTEAS
jgi:MFS family permease